VDQESVERIRSATFNIGRRGYDKREVDTYLARLADWLENGAVGETDTETARRELERIGQRTARVLTAAGEAAEELKADAAEEAREVVDGARIEANAARVEAERYVESVRGDADDYAETVRGKADAYAQEQRRKADQEAQEIVGGAQTEAKQALEGGQKRREELKKVIGDLEHRRDDLLDELERLAGSLVGTASEHRRPEPPTEQVEAEGEAGEDEKDLTEETREAPAEKG
jgi:DivIVA domain-containing protein